MILFTHQVQLLKQPVIEFENHDGRLVQLISRVKKHGFGPHPVDIKPVITDQKIFIEIIPNENTDNEIMGLFYMPNTLSYKVANPEFTLMECLAKYKIEPYYQPRLGFYRMGVEIHKYYSNYDNKIAKYIWKLDPELGWNTIHPVNNARLRFV